MIRYLFTRLAYSVVSLLIMITLTFIMMKSIPGDPFTEEKALPQKVLENLYRHYGLDKPLYIQYLSYLRSLASWDLGTSLVYPTRSVNDIIAKTFPVSLTLGLQALMLALCGGTALGVLSACYYKTFKGSALSLFSIVLISIPSFILASLLQYVVAIHWGWLPVARWGDFSHTILPALALAAYPFAYISRLTHSSMVGILQADYIKNAQAKGLSKARVILRHALPNALVPVVSYLGQFTASILTGSFIIEKIFGIPGLGQWYVSSIMNRDYPVILGTTIFYSVLLMGLMFLSDLLYALLDPRIQMRKKHV